MPNSKRSVKVIIPFAGRVNVARNGDDYGDNGKGGMVAFAWYVWVHGYCGAPRLGWI